MSRLPAGRILTPALLAAGLAVFLFLLMPGVFSTRNNSEFDAVKQPDIVAMPTRLQPAAAASMRAETAPATNPVATLDADAIALSPFSYNVYGRVSDADNRPLAGVLVSDEHTFASVRSDFSGRYQITVPRHKVKTPLLNFLRHGYRENRVGIATHDAPYQSDYEVNVALHSAFNTTNVAGWIGNDLGAGLAGRKIRIRVQQGQGAGAIFYGTISNEAGDFRFEGIRAGLAYKLEIEPSTNYAGYTLAPFKVTQQTPHRTIILERLKLANIEGLIVDIANAPVANFSFNTQNLSLDYPDQQITSDSSGFFRLQNFPTGELKFSSHTPDYFKVTGVNLHADNYQNLTLTIDMGNYFLSGWISDENGAPVANARVTLDSRFDRHGYQSYSQRSLVTDSSGEFEFNHLGDVIHRISVHAKDYPSRSLNHQFASYSDRVEIRLLK